MASTTGVTNSGRGKTSKRKKQQRLIWIGGGAVALILYMDRKGSQANNSAGTASGQLSAYEQGVQDASGLNAANAGLGMGSGGTGDTSGASNGGGGNGTGGNGGSGDTTGTTGNGSSAGGADNPGVGGGGTTTFDPGSVVINAPASKKGGPVRKAARKPKRNAESGRHKKTAKGHKPATHVGGSRIAGHPNGGRPEPVKREHRPVPKPAAAHPTRPAPASHNGTHRETSHSNRRGRAKNSPVEEMPLNHSSGVVVLGRAFPGATGHRLGPPRRVPGGGIVRDVTIFFGGFTEVHTVDPHTRTWETNTRGRNPLQNRTIPQIEAA